MNEFDIHIYTKSEELPSLLGGDFFHSQELFLQTEKVPGSTPYMVVVKSRKGEVVAQMLAITRRRGSWIPPYIYTHAHVNGIGVYKDISESSRMFQMMLERLTRYLDQKLCLFIEFAGIRKKMFGYRYFRKEGYIPIPWQEVHNSLHSLPPDQRLSLKHLSKIQKLEEKGVSCKIAESEEEIAEFYHLLKNQNQFNFRRHIPAEEYFQMLHASNHGNVFITKYRAKVVGGCCCIYSEGNAYLCYLGHKMGHTAWLRPDTITIWQAILHAYAQHCAHFYFMDVGFPWKRSRYREFILSFGGKPVTKYRWFRFYPSLINQIIKWVYKE